MVRTNRLSGPDNPSDETRYNILKYILRKYDREEDFPYLIKGLSPPTEITNIAPAGTMKGKRIAIIGAGVAGLTAAYELRKTGADIDVIEAQQDHIGGKVITYYFDKTNYGELGPMRLPVSHECLWHYINLFKLNTFPFVMSNPKGFIYIRNQRVRNDSQGMNVMEHIYPEFNLTEEERTTSWQDLLTQGLMEPLNTLTPQQRQEVLYQLVMYSPEVQYWFDKSVIDTMFEMGLSRGAIDMLSGLSLVLGGFSNSGYSEIFQENYTGDFEFLYQIRKGTSQLTMAFYNALISKEGKSYDDNIKNSLGNINFKMGTEATHITYLKRLDQVQLTTTSNNKQHNAMYDYVLCCMPYSKASTMQFNPLLGLNRSWGIQEIYYQDIQKTIFYCKKRFWLEEPFMINSGCSLTDLSIKTIWYPDDGVTDPNARGVLLACYNVGLSANRVGTLSDKNRVELIKRQVELVHGLPKGYMDNIVIDYKTVSYKDEEWYQGMCYYNPSQKILFASGFLQNEYNNRLLFSGVHASSTHGWMQGAIKTSMESANQILEDFVNNQK